RIAAYEMMPRTAQERFGEGMPEVLERDHRGEPYSVSFASDAGFALFDQALRRFVRHVEEQPWADHVLGYQLFLEFEGVPWGGAEEGAFTDYSEPMRDAWRSFLHHRYASDAALAEAWGDPEATRDAELPTPEEHLGEDRRFLFHHPKRGRKARDYYGLAGELLVKRHRQLARAIKDACDGRRFLAVMGGYLQAAGESRSIVSRSGFPAMRLHKLHLSGGAGWPRAYDIPEIDAYFAPTDYLDTGVGGVGLPLHVPASLALHGKVGWIEDDLRTHLERRRPWNPQLPDARASVMAHRRNAALLYTQAGATDWMEQTHNWLLDEEILANLGQLNKLLQTSIDAPELTDPGICLLIDTDSQMWTKPVVDLDELLFYRQRHEGLHRSGVPVRFHLLEDLAREDFPDYRCYILMNAWHWTPAKDKLLDRVRRDGNVLVWLYGAGYVGMEDFDPARMAETTGIQIQAEPHRWAHRVRIVDYEHPITRDLPADLVFGTNRVYGPVFRTEDPAARVLGRGTGPRMSSDAMFAVRDFGRGARASQVPGPRGDGDYSSVWCEAPNLPADLLRGLARYGGCHIYLESNDVLMAGRDLVMIHSAKPGARTLRLPGRFDVTEPLTGRVIASDTDQVQVELEQPGTALYRLRRPQAGSSPD
ncbi:MAG: hypothetical protein ACOC9P_03020, partial [bacterium]